MFVKDYLVNFLIDMGVTDVFGLPGGVVLDFVSAIQQKSTLINARLSFHEQSAVFSAIGFSRATDKLGVAYATRGPGITNTLTAVSDAYYDSVPVLLITGHSGDLSKGSMRILSDQEMDVVSIFSHVTKFASRVETPEDFVISLQKATLKALTGRKGPVLLDVRSDIWNKEIPTDIAKLSTSSTLSPSLLDNGLCNISDELDRHSCPVLLLGDGFRGRKKATKEVIDFSNKNQIPILSSRFSQDLFKGAKFYFGYFGSHGLRSGNFILSKVDLMISIGNRMVYPLHSDSFNSLMKNIKVLRFDIDKDEFERSIPNSTAFHVDLEELAGRLAEVRSNSINSTWILRCFEVERLLKDSDNEYPIDTIKSILNQIPEKSPIVSDVGNNEFWLCKAYYGSQCRGKMLFSKSFGAMGSALGKAIGFSHGSKERVFCFVGDHGMMINIQDLHYIAKHKLPIVIFLINNQSSGMIRSRQKHSGRKIMQTTIETGYSIPDFVRVSEAFNIKVISYSSNDSMLDWKNILSLSAGPLLVEICVDSEVESIPHLPIGEKIQNLMPSLSDELLGKLNSL